GAFVEKFTLSSESQEASHSQLPLRGLTFAVKDIFDIEGYITGFGNPDWVKTHSVATSTAPAVVSLIEAGATCIGKTVMDEMAYSINGENAHYGTPTNPRAADRVPGGSSSGSAVAVGALLADFSLGTDTGGSVRVPASYCGIFGFRPSHGTVSSSGVIPMAPSFDTVGWFARDPIILRQVGHVLLQLKDDDHELTAKFSRIIVAKDCLSLLDTRHQQLTQVLISSIEELYGNRKTEHINLGEYIEPRVPSLKHFIGNIRMDGKEDDNIPPSLAALSNSMRLLQRYEFKKHHSEWINSVQPHLGTGIAERVRYSLETTDENIGTCLSLKSELNSALTDLLGDFGILAMPTVPGPPPKLQMEPVLLERYRAKAFGLLSVAGMSGFCQAHIPLGMDGDDLPVGVSLIAKSGSDGFLLSFVETIYQVVKKK
ncbi:hypothetical protein M569_10030, partial [Genlisea aurea]